MLNCTQFHEMLAARGVDFFTGVPDSLLKDLGAYLADHVPGRNHIIAAGEGGAVALAMGHYLATGKPGMVYLQNSGLGNAVNPLVSLADPDVYGIPMLLVVGWRGEPGTRDEPQHAKQGKITLGLLKALDIPFRVLEPEAPQAEQALDELFAVMHKTGGPVALVVRDGAFHPNPLARPPVNPWTLSREAAIAAILGRLDPADRVVCTTGKASRELYELRAAKDGGHQRDFLTVGGMGHASQIALGIALAQPSRQVFCLDGDGAALMHLGALAINGAQDAPNLKHILLNNGCHDSVGGQPTVGFGLSFTQVAQACGYRIQVPVQEPEALAQAVALLRERPGPGFLEVRLQAGARGDLGRPRSRPGDNLREFMAGLRP